MNNIMENDLSKFGKVYINAPMKDWTTFKTGGTADCLIIPTNVNTIPEIISYAKNNNIPLTVIGWGSNLVISDKGLRGLVLRISDYDDNKSAINLTSDGLVECSASVKKEDFVKWGLQNGYKGMEFMTGIPGCIGGGIVMNAGTNMGTFCDILKKVEYLDNNGVLHSEAVSREMGHYRKFDITDYLVFTKAYFALTKTDDIAALKNTIQTLNDERKVKHPLSYPSAGSVFKNPEGHFSWKLVNDSGLRGYSIGGAQVSELHTNFIINKSNATSTDIRNLVNHVITVIKQKYGIDMHPEIKFLGEFD